MAKAERVPELVHGDVLEVDTSRTARACVVVQTTFVKDDIGVDKTSARVVPPIRLTHEAIAVVAEEHLILVVQRQRRTVRGTGIDKLDVGVALRTPRLGA